MYRLSLSVGTPLGGVLTLSTCGLSANDTVLYLGTGCPTYSGAFNCIVGNDNGAAPGCGANALASALTHVTASSVYFVQLGAAGGGAVVSGLRWSYVPPAASSRTATSSRTPTPTPTPSRSRSATPTRTPPATASRSRTRKARAATNPRGGRSRF